VNLEKLRLWILPLLKDTPFYAKSWFAGGCVRDYLLQKERSEEFQFAIKPNGLDSCLHRKDINPESETKTHFNKDLSDVDICVNLPQGGILLAKHLYKRLKGKSNGLKVYPAFGTASFRYESLKLEFVATRKEIYRPANRYPKVEFGSLEEDVLRRDFTINALLMDITNGNIMDLCGLGLQDLISGIIRSLGEPEIKFAEDPIRMLRAVRFSLRFGFTIEAATWKALISQASKQRNLSARLMNMEIEKMLSYCPQEELDELFEILGWRMWVLEE
jgi:poly(A) polymerase